MLNTGGFVSGDLFCLQDLQDRLADLCAVDYIHKKVDILWCVYPQEQRCSSAATCELWSCMKDLNRQGSSVCKRHRSEDADLELARLAVSRWDGQQNFFQVVGEDVPDAELPAALQSHAATTRMVCPEIMQLASFLLWSSYWARFRLVCLSIGTHTTHQRPVSTTLHAVQNRLYKLVAKMGQVDSEVYPPLTALRGALKDAPDYIIAIGSRLQGW